MGYVEDTLIAGEKINCRAIISKWIYCNPLNFIILAFFMRWTTEMVVTDRRLIFKTGFISRKTNEIPLSKVESISINQSIMGRLLNYGDISVVGSGATLQCFETVSDPILFKNAIDASIAAKNYM